MVLPSLLGEDESFGWYLHDYYAGPEGSRLLDYVEELKATRSNIANFDTVEALSTREFGFEVLHLSGKWNGITPYKY